MGDLCYFAYINDFVDREVPLFADTYTPLISLAVEDDDALGNHIGKSFRFSTVEVRSSFSLYHFLLITTLLLMCSDHSKESMNGCLFC